MAMAMTLTNVLAMVINMVIVIGPELGGKSTLRREQAALTNCPAKGISRILYV